MLNESVIVFLCISSILFYAAIAVLGYQIYLLKKEKIDSGINRIVHLGTGAVPIREMELTERAGIVIGRQSGGIKPDFDLSGGDKSNNIAPQHAVLNRINTDWYVEALENQYQVGIKKAGDNIVYRLKILTPYKVEAGDMIYISYEKVILR